jgi:hypothetical protein
MVLLSCNFESINFYYKHCTLAQCRDQCQAFMNMVMNFGLNLHPKEEKLIQIYLVILITFVLCNSKDKSVL